LTFSVRSSCFGTHFNVGFLSSCVTNEVRPFAFSGFMCSGITCSGTHLSERQLRGQERKLTRVAGLISSCLGTFGKQTVELKYVSVPLSSLALPDCGGGRRRTRCNGKTTIVPRRPDGHGVAVLVGSKSKFPELSRPLCPRRPLVLVIRQEQPVDTARVSAALDRFPWFGLGCPEDWKLLRLKRPFSAVRRQSYQVVV
jgi:hypothetical protein